MPTKIDINESFPDIQPIPDHYSKNFLNPVSACMKNNGLSSQLRGQGYDGGAANMSNVYSGVQERLQSNKHLMLMCTAQHTILIWF